MDRKNAVKERQLDIAMEAAKRWDETKSARADQQTEIAKKGPLAAETPKRAQQFQRREALRARLQVTEGIRRVGPGLERMIGSTLDLRDLPSGPEAERAGQPVARLIDPPEPGLVSQGFGTGFLVSPRLLMTNHHVFPDKASARVVAQFGFEHDVAGLHAGTNFRLAPDTLFFNDERLDFSLVAVEPRSEDGLALQQFGYLPLIAATGKILLGQPVSIIQHPMGGPKQWAETENKLLFLNDEMPYMQYQTDTLPGSSGSPVYNSFWELVGLHHSGVPRVENGRIKTRKDEDWDENRMTDDDIDWIANEGVRVSCLVQFLREIKPETDVQKQLMAELLAQTADPLEKTSVLRTTSEGGTLMPLLPNGTPSSVSIVVNGNATFYINGSTTQASLPASTSGPALVVAALEKKLRFDPKYANRPGYSPTFLTGQVIPLPNVASARLSEVLNDESGAPLVLKYHHYSVQMNKERKLMMWSAANVNYSAAKRPVTGRDTFGTDTWKADPRIPAAFQLEDAEFYSPAQKFDRGHIVRREDNAWGDDATLQEFANSDSFHWTNCTPQHEAFNRSNLSGLWGELENHITEQAGGVENSKLTIFAGPVLADDDLEHDFGAGVVKVPIRFWKIISVIQQTTAAGPPRLATFGFVLEQDSVIRAKGLEAFEVGKFKTFQQSLPSITALTGVEFPEILLKADVKKGSPARSPLESLRELTV